MEIESNKDCIKPSKRQLLYQKTQKAAKRYGMIVSVLIYLCLCATLYVWQKRFVTFGLLLITCCFFKSTLLKKILAICSIALLATIYYIKKSQFGFSIFTFMGLGQSTPTTPKLDDHFVDTAGYCYFVLQPDQIDFDELVFYIENEEERFGDVEMTKEFMSNYFDIYDLNQKIGLFVRYEDTDYTIGYDNGIMKFVEKSISIFEDNILPFKAFDTLKSIDERDYNNKVILCFHLPKNSDEYKEYAKEAIKSDYDGLFYLTKHFFYSVIGSNDGKIIDVYCHKDKTMKTIKIGYESVIEFTFDK